MNKEKNMYNTIFFDIGNTLFFFNYEFMQEFLAQRFGVSVTKSELEEKHIETKRSLLAENLILMPHEDLWAETYRRWLTSVGVSEEMVPSVTRAIREHPFTHLFWSRMEEGTKEMLDWFRERGYKLGVISNAEGQIKRLIEHAALQDRFEVIVDSGVVGFAKPDQRIFKHAVSQMGADPDRSIHVGDIFEVDVLGAKNVGITPILVDPKGNHSDKSCLKIKRVLDLPKLSLFSGE